MSWVSRAEIALDIVLRIPSLVLMDSVLNKSFLAFLFQYEQWTWQLWVPWLLLMILFFFLGLFLFFLTVRQLLEIYSYAVNVAIIMFSYWCNLQYVLKVHMQERQDVSFFTHSIVDLVNDHQSEFYRNLVLQVSLASLHLLVSSIRWGYRGDSAGGNVFQAFAHVAFFMPLFIRWLHKDEILFLWSPFLGTVIPIFKVFGDIMFSLRSAFFMVRRFYAVTKLTLGAIGIQAYVEHQWIRLHVPSVLRVFFICRFTYQLVTYLIVALDTFPSSTTNSFLVYFSHYLDLDVLLPIAQKLLIRSCETFIAVLGTASVVSVAAHHLGVFMAFCIGTVDDDTHMGTMVPILFCILALQTGLTGLDPQSRLTKLYRNFCLLSTAILHYVHSMVSPVLLSLSASRNRNVLKHARALAMCVFLVSTPLYLIYYLWSHHSLSPWLLAVTAFGIEVCLKVTITLLVYSLFMIDAYRDTFWEKLDDYVYYVQSTGNTIEFLFGIFLFFNGGWIMIFESGGAVRAIMMCIHAYFNIWVQAKEGWKVFMNRRTAVHKINSLPEASPQQLEELNDVCAICYQELKSARVTRCNHFFHSVCLRKWLYVQDHCPLCHKVITNNNNATDLVAESNDLDQANQNNLQDAHNMGNHIH